MHLVFKNVNKTYIKKKVVDISHLDYPLIIIRCRPLAQNDAGIIKRIRRNSILDEPFSGLDPVNTELLKNIVLELTKQGKYIIMSSHQMAQIEEFCSDILILNKGKCILQGNLKEIKDSYEANKVEIITHENIEKHLKELNLKAYQNVNNNYLINIKSEDEGYKLFDLLTKNKVRITKFELKKPSLHDIFIEKAGK